MLSDLPVEGNFRSGLEANGDIRFADRAKSAREGVLEMRGDELVTHFGRARR